MSSLFTRRKTDLVKGFAILFMYIHHFYLDPSRYEGFPIYFFLGEEFVNKVAVFMKICVAMFMFLSGYGMYLSAQKKQGEHALALYSIKRYIKLIFSFFFIFLASNNRNNNNHNNDQNRNNYSCNNSY